jgi:PPP family 3-phenylpropionic acid transporter
VRNISVRISVIQAASGIMSGAYLPFFSASLEARGLTPAAIGLLLATATGLRIVVAPAAGLMADARDDRRIVMLVFSALAFAGFVLFAVIRDPREIFVSGVAAIVLWGATGPLLESATLRLAERSGTAYGQYRVWLSFAFVATNVVAGFATARFGFGVVAPWIAAAAGLQLCAVYGLPVPPKSGSAGAFASRLRATFAEARELAMKPVFMLFLVIASLIQGSHIVYYSYSGLHWHDLGYSASTIGLLWPLGVTTEIALFIFSARVVRRIDAVSLLALGGVACAIRWAVMAFDPAPVWLILTQFSHGLTFALPHLGAMYFILRATPPRLSATAQSLYSVVAIGLTSSLALLPVSYYYVAWGGRIYLLMSAMGVVAALLSVLLHARWNGGRLTERAATEAESEAL